MVNSTSHPAAKKVMLIFPPMANVRFTNNICSLPMGVASLAAYLREHSEVELQVLDAVVEGHDRIEELGPDIIKFGLSYDEILKRIEKFGPEVLGVSCLFSSQFPMVREIAWRARKLAPELFIITGGSYPSFYPEHCLRTSEVDAVILGEGERPLLELIRRLSSSLPLENLPAIAYKDKDRIVVSPERQMVENLDTLPWPARDLFPVEKYFAVNLPMQAISRHRRNLSLATSRGCPYHCRFCSSTLHWGRRYRVRSVENVLDEMEHLKAQYHIREIKFEDDNLTFDEQRAKSLFRGMIARRLNLFWNTPNGIAIRHLDDEMLSLMKESGCYELTLALESGDPFVLKHIIHKPLDLEEAKRVARRIQAHGIPTAGYFIVGFPGETRAQVENTLRFALELKLERIYIFMYTPLPGTELAEKALREGLVREGFDFEKENNYFLPSVKLPDLTSEELVRLQRRAFWKNNLGLLWRRPDRFFRKYGHTLLTHPDLVWKFFTAVRG